MALLIKYYEGAGMFTSQCGAIKKGTLGIVWERGWRGAGGKV